MGGFLVQNLFSPWLGLGSHPRYEALGDPLAENRWNSTINILERACPVITILEGDCPLNNGPKLGHFIATFQ